MARPNPLKMKILDPLPTQPMGQPNSGVYIASSVHAFSIPLLYSTRCRFVWLFCVGFIRRGIGVQRRCR